jgi:hypothetical protein
LPPTDGARCQRRARPIAVTSPGDAELKRREFLAGLAGATVTSCSQALRAAESHSESTQPTKAAASVSHGQLLSIHGSGFGTKSRGLAPLIRDTGTAPLGTVDAQWWDWSPRTRNRSYRANNMMLHAPGYDPWRQGIGVPHPYVKAIYAGTTLTEDSTLWNWESYLGWEFLLPATIQSGDDCCIYARWYERNDPTTPLSKPQPSPNNKIGAYGPGGYAQTRRDEASPQSYIWTIINWSGPHNTTDASYVISLQDNTNRSPPLSIIEVPDRAGNGRNHLWGSRANTYNPKYGWIQVELEMCIDTRTGSSGRGYLNYVVNGQRNIKPVFYPAYGSGVGTIIGYQGRTDNFMSIHEQKRAINFGCGLYNNCHSDEHTVAYYADFYCDMSAGGVSGQVARVVMGDAPTYAASGMLVPLVIRSWTDGLITATVHKDRAAGGQAVYFHVITENGAVKDNVLSGVLS